ncbi:MAG: hypothetical protein KAW87_05545 [Candidatus Cloacimonetes bacterium]|nr:hypothetical protein [Candidatus Cloacimonadota bacterium]
MIIVGVAVAVGMQMFATQRAGAELQAITADLTAYASQVLAWLATPAHMGGGAADIIITDAASIATWIGWAANPNTTDNAAYTLATAVAGTCTITANNDAASKISIPEAATALSGCTLEI